MKTIKVTGIFGTAVIFLLVLTSCAVPEKQDESAGIIFSHALHITDAEMDCSDCHAAAASSSVMTDRLLPAKSVCGTCHDVNADCAMCHDDPTRAATMEQRGKDLIFPHAVHTDSEIACLRCHTGVNESTRAKDRFSPTMELCWSCHNGGDAPNFLPVNGTNLDGQIMPLTSTCLNCHKGDGSESFLPVNHDAFWKDSHGLAARGNQSDCYQCHESAGCTSCHDGRVDSAVHPRFYQTTHGIEAQANPQKCGTCHSKQYCRRCHG